MQNIIQESNEIAFQVNKLEHLIKPLLKDLCKIYINSDLDINLLIKSIDGKLLHYTKILRDYYDKYRHNEYITIKQLKLYIDTIVNLYNYIMVQDYPEDVKAHLSLMNICLEILESEKVIFGTFKELHNTLKEDALIMVLDDCRIVKYYNYPLVLQEEVMQLLSEDINLRIL